MRRGAASATLLAGSAHVSATNFRNMSTSGAAHKGADCIVEFTDLASAVPGDTSSDTWSTKAKVALQQLLKRIGPVLEVKIPTSVAKVRFGSARSVEALMKAAPRGYIALGDGELRVRFPGSSEAVWQKFPPPRKPAATEAPSAQGADSSKKRKLRPNERFAKRMPGVEEPDESERFWDEQHEKRKEPTVMPPPPAESSAPEPEVVKAPEPERPIPAELGTEPTADDQAVLEGEHAVATMMATLLEQPFSQQRKALKALRKQWHPDKRPDDQAIATRVFQFIQAHDEWLAHHGLA